MNETRELIEVNSTLELRDVIPAWRHVAFRSRQMPAIPILMLAFILLGLTMHETALISGGVTGTLTVACWAFYYTPRKVFRSAPMIVGNQTWSISPYIIGFESRNRDGELLWRSVIPWRSMWKTMETDDGFILMSSETLMAILPKRFLDEHSQVMVREYSSKWSVNKRSGA